MKICTKCQTEKSLSEFYKNAKKKDGLQAWCKSCSTKRRAEWGRENPDKVARNARYVNYRLRDEDFTRMLEEQNNSCKLCGNEFTDTLARHIDHDHITGEVRGILCRRCNHIVGWYEAIDDHQAVLSYLGRV